MAKLWPLLLACKEMVTRVKETFDLDGSSSLQALLAGFTNGTASTEI